MKTNNSIRTSAMNSLLRTFQERPKMNGKKLVSLSLQLVMVFSLVLTITVPSTSSFVNSPLADFGDAPDPTYPTLRNTTSTSFPNRTGPYHLDVTQEWIGPAAPNSTTTVEPDALITDLDFDDGLNTVKIVEVEGSITDTAYVTIPVTISSEADSQVRYLNVVADLNKDGHWSGYTTGGGINQSEWIIVNLAIFTEPATAVNASVPFALKDRIVVPAYQTWLRATLTTEYINPAIFEPYGWDGSGPIEGFLRGETEDALITIEKLVFPKTPPGIIKPPPPTLPPPGPPVQPLPPPEKGKEKENTPDIPQKPYECAPTAVANSLYYLAGANGFLDRLPQERELIEELKRTMQWVPNIGVYIDNFVGGKKKITQERGLPIKTDVMNTEEGQIPTVEFIITALERCDAVEIAMVFDGGGGHCVTVVGYTKYPDGSVRLKIHDPDDGIDGDVSYWVGRRGSYISLNEYPVPNRIYLACAQSCTGPPTPPMKNPGELISATLNGPQTVDPNVANDEASWKLISNVYDTLLTSDGEHTDSYLPSLATSWTIQDIQEQSPEGLDWTYRYVFQVRQGVKFHDELYTLTPQDVEYSFESVLVKDYFFGPAWMLYEPLLYGESASFINQQDMDLSDPATIVMVGKMLDHSVESDGTQVWFNIAFPGAYSPFLQILCQSWASVLSKQWINDYVIGQLGRPSWNGEWGDYSEWIGFHDSAASPLDDPTPLMMGTGPFMLESLDYTAEQWTVVRFPDYWRGWPADFPASGSAKPAGYVDRFVVTWAFNWETRKTMFLNGDIDICAVPKQNVGEVLDRPGIRCIYPLPTLYCNALFFQLNIDPTTPYGPVYPAGTFEETGIPSDFFGNPTWGTHVRKAFAYALDYETLITDVGDATHPATAIIPGLKGYDPTVKGFTYNLTAAVQEFRAVPGLWDTGFTITLFHTSSTLRQHCAQLLKDSIRSLNPKFQVNIGILTGQEYDSAVVNRQIPTFAYGWFADYPDAHNLAYPFYRSTGYLAATQGYSDPQMDALIEAGIATPDGPERAKIYSDIQKLVIEKCPSITIIQSVVRHFERDWVNGWYYNPIYSSGTYAYNLWKWYYIPQASFGNATTPPWSNRLPCDVNYDGQVNIIDIVVVAQAFGSSYGPPIDPRWQFRGDIDNNRVINIVDIAAVASYFTWTSGRW